MSDEWNGRFRCNATPARRQRVIRHEWGNHRSIQSKIPNQQSKIEQATIEAGNRLIQSQIQNPESKIA